MSWPLGLFKILRGEVLSYTGREEDQGLEVVGSYFYIGDDGRTYVVGYTAGKDGFRPYGIHIPPSAGVEQPGAGFGSCSATLAGCGLG
ncbi:hypothetical protein NQ314_019249 [Rhamnusium bicolor]|uniref:Uncharacterized protein n=1 Tax=Rhamnusium bicolor TaxID=1586634 RepID=A0AAV8WNK3_9CUCU|nr:hypothetical protein NQ314_019249 [Rhamnusium bicolor]